MLEQASVGNHGLSSHGREPSRRERVRTQVNADDEMEGLELLKVWQQRLH